MNAIINAIVTTVAPIAIFHKAKVQFGYEGETGFHTADCNVLATRNDGLLLVTHDNWMGSAHPLHNGNRKDYPEDVVAVCTHAAREENITRFYKDANGLLSSLGFGHMNVEMPKVAA